LAGALNMSEERRKYKNDYLDKVIVRIDFDTTLPFSTEAPPTEIYVPVKERFPIVEEKKLIGKRFIVGNKEALQDDIEELEWHYSGKQREKLLKVTPRHMHVEYNKYEHYEQLREDFISVSNELFDKFPKLKARRLGFRYIDKIELDEDDPTNWDNYIIPALNSNLSIVHDKTTLSRAFHVIEFNYGDSNLRFQYGMLNPDYPATIKKKVYTLDFDMFTENILEKHEIIGKLNDFHTKLNKSFEEVITEELRNKMEPVNES
jgi:uncharacterized protein (TIGR04255 family)